MLAHALALVHRAQMAPVPPVVEVLLVPVELEAVVPVVAWGQLQVLVEVLQVTEPQSAALLQPLPGASQKPPAGLLVLQ